MQPSRGWAFNPPAGWCPLGASWLPLPLTPVAAASKRNVGRAGSSFGQGSGKDWHYLTGKVTINIDRSNIDVKC